MVDVLLFYPLGSVERMDRSLQRFDVHWLRNMSIHAARKDTAHIFAVRIGGYRDDLNGIAAFFLAGTNATRCS